MRTTAAGTWFPAVGPHDEPAGLLLIHPAVQLDVLGSTITRLAELDLPGVLPMNPELVHQAGRTWLITTAPPVPTLTDMLDTGEHQGPGNAAVVLSEVAATLLAVHRAGLAHGLVNADSVLFGPDGPVLLTDWGSTGTATPADDIDGWTELARLLTERWCADLDPAAAVLARAADAATATGLAAASDELAALAATASRETLARAATAEPASNGRNRVPTTRPARPNRVLPPTNTATPAEPGPRATPDPSSAEPTWASDTPPLKPPKRTVQRTPRWQLVLITVLTTVTLSALAVTLFQLLDRDRAPGPSAAVPGVPADQNPGVAPLEVRSVILETEQSGSICALLGVITTNGRAGTIVYRWTGDTVSQPIMLVNAPENSPRIKIGLLSTPGSGPMQNSVVTLQVLQPQARQAAVQPSSQCR